MWTHEPVKNSVSLQSKVKVRKEGYFLGFWTVTNLGKNTAKNESESILICYHG